MKSIYPVFFKSAAVTLIILLSVFTSCNKDGVDPANSWKRVSNFPRFFSDSPPTFTIGTKAYVFRTKELWEYNQSTDTWTQKKSLPSTSGDKKQAFAFALNGKGYIGCGGDTINSNDFWEYDPSTDTWTQKTNFPGAKRYGSQCFVVNGKAYVIGGDNISDGLPILTDVWEFDANTDQWTQKNDFTGIGRIDAVAFAIGTKGYLGTGYNSTVTPYLKDFYEYDPGADTWTPKADFPDANGRSVAIGFSLGDKGFVGTGFKGNGEGHSDFWQFDPLKNTWTQKQDVGSLGRYWAAAFAIGNTGYVGGGANGESEELTDSSGTHSTEFVWAYTFQ